MWSEISILPEWPQKLMNIKCINAIIEKNICTGLFKFSKRLKYNIVENGKNTGKFQEDQIIVNIYFANNVLLEFNKFKENYVFKVQRQAQHMTIVFGTVSDLNFALHLRGNKFSLAGQTHVCFALHMFNMCNLK